MKGCPPAVKPPGCCEKAKATAVTSAAAVLVLIVQLDDKVLIDELVAVSTYTPGSLNFIPLKDATPDTAIALVPTPPLRAPGPDSKSMLIVADEDSTVLPPASDAQHLTLSVH